MKNIFGILQYVKGYWRFAILNITFNLLSAVFGLFSIAMLFPFLQVLFSDDSKKLEEILLKGKPEFHLSPSAIMENINYFLASDIQAHDSLHVLVGICVFIIITIFLKNLFRYLGMFFIAPIRNGVVKDMRNNIFKKILVLPLSYYSDERKGDIMSRMTADVREIEWSVLSSLEMIFREPVTIFIYLLSMFLMSWQLTTLALLLLPIAGLVIGRIGKSLKKTSTEEKEKTGILMSIMDETLGGLRIVKAFNAEKNVKQKFEKINNDYTNLMVKAYRRVDLSSPLSEFMGITVFVIILYVGGKMVLGNHPAMSGAIFITYLALFSQLIAPSKSFTTAYYNIQKGLASTERVNKILNAEVTIQDPKSPKTLVSFEKQIEYKNVSFAYREAEIGWVLNNINLKVEKGKTIALVGQSGSGKTTMADMLPRFYDPSQGEILIDGIGIKDITLTDLRSLMGIVTQESILFNDTLFNNIAFGMENITEAQVIEAAKIANAHEFISLMPQGYQTNIGDRGNKLSGGQRQRVSIARAVLKNPPILILDEATSALDTESERLVQDALNKLMKNRTSLVIAHRLSTIQHADEIIVMQKGEIIEQGTHTVLLAKNGAYRKLHDLQSFV
jgi:ATP-binding cassette, subfamily B, bacterial MsbA